MVEKVLYCPKCKYIQEDPDKFSTICPKCGNECEEEHVLKREDIGVLLKEKGYPKNIVDFFSKKEEDV